MGPVTIDPDKPTDLTFTADGSGILTLTWTGSKAITKLELFDTTGKAINYKPYANKNETDKQLLHYVAMPLSNEGDYRVRLTANQASTIKIGTAWMPFPQIDPDYEENMRNELATHPKLTHLNRRLDGLPEIPIGHVLEGNNGSGRPRSYLYKADGKGVLTIAVRGKGDVDMRIQANDDRGQSISGGQVDIDFGGDTGAEQIAIHISRPGDIEIAIVPHAGGAYYYSGSWLATAAPTGPDE